MKANEQLTIESNELYEYVNRFQNKYRIFKDVIILWDRKEKHWILNMPFDDDTTDALRCYGRSCDEIIDALKDFETTYERS